MDSLKVGDVIYVISPDVEKILPYIVTEEMIRKTIAGEKRTLYLTSVRSAQPVTLESIKGNIHSSLESAIEQLRTKLEKWLSTQAAEAQEEANRLLGTNANPV